MTTWNLDDIYEEEKPLLDKLKKLVNEVKAERNNLDKLNTEQFVRILENLEKIKVLSSKIATKASLKYTENTTNPEYIEKLSKTREILTELDNELIFFYIWFKSLDDKKAKELSDNKYNYYLNELRRFKKYTKSESEEKIINILDLTGDDIHSDLYDLITNKFTFEWEGKEINKDELIKYVRDKDPKKRKTAYLKLLNKFKENSDLISEIYKLIVRTWYNKNIRIRGYDNPIQVENYSHPLPDKTVKMLLEVIQENSSLFREYFKLKEKIIKQKITRFDIYAPYSYKEEKQTYEESKEIVLSAYKNFSIQTYDILKEMFEKNHIHPFPSKGKQTGAFCQSISNDVLPYISMNHTGNIEDLFTLAHELGHALHFILSKNLSEYTNHAALPLAEVASTFGELILTNHLLKNSDKNEKIKILMKSIEGDYATITRQAYFSLFEIKAHDMIQKGALPNEIDDIYIKLIKEQFKNIEVDDLFKNEWKYIPHFFHYPFYVYSYSFANLLSLALFKMCEKEKDKFIPKYIKILSSGGNSSPENILKEVGIDINDKKFWKKGFNILKERIDELKKLL